MAELFRLHADMFLQRYVSAHRGALAMFSQSESEFAILVCKRLLTLQADSVVGLRYSK